jgi:uncharacterized repeat protein (TIGR03803 family)
LTPQQSLAQQAYHILHPFGRSSEDGTNPAADLIDIKGTLYGTTVAGGDSCCSGTVFSVTTSGKEMVLYRFASSDRSDGYQPAAGLLDVKGMLYGTTSGGGTTNSAGTVFSVTLGGTEKVLHSFDFIGGGGSAPLAGLINVNGTLYGTTSGTYPYDYGTVFSITTRGKYKVLHRFGESGDDGANPKAALLNVGGTLYGTTAHGGRFGGGTVFSINMGGQEDVLHEFRGGDDGAVPSSALIDVQGTLYGTTAAGGPSGDGTVFSITTPGIEKVVHTFSGRDGSQPVAALKNVRGVLYGTTRSGGSNNLGTVFKIAKSGKETVVHSFARGDGVNPVAGVIAVGGTLYGTTYGNGPHSLGDVYSLTP